MIDFSSKLPPHNIEAEVVLLGSLLIDPKTLPELTSRFPNIAEAFFDPQNRNVFQAAVDLEAAGRPVEIVGIGQLLKDRNQLGEHGQAYLGGLQLKGIGASTAEYYGEILIEQFTRREAIRLGMEMMRRGYDDGDVESLVTDAIKSANDLANLRTAQSEKTMLQLAQRTLDVLDLAKKRKEKGQMLGIQTGLFGLDKMTGGLRGGQLIIIAARPGYGKTSLAMNIAEYAAVENKIPTAVFSLEMSDESLTMRMACSRAGIDSQKARDGELNPLEEQRLAAAMPAISKAPLHIYPARAANISVLSSIARRSHAKHGIKMIVVDYLQLIHGAKRSYSNRVAEITEISGALKSLAMELDVPVIAPAQLNRSNDKEDRPPRLSDLRDSGSIEQDADLCLFLNPAKGADIEAPVVPFDGIIAKQREGRVGTVPLTFRKVLTRFTMREQSR